MERKQWLDVCKGIGIILVVLGHLICYDRFISRWIFAFHMPLFFFCSGVVFKEQDNFLILLKRKVKVILLPYILFYFVGFMFTMLIPTWREEVNVSELLHYLYIGQPEMFHVGQIWFLICLFWVEKCIFF